MTPPALRASFIGAGELVVDCFAGGGGASTGIEAALGRPVDIAINHDADAVAMHAVNHPHTRHYCESVWRVDPREACAGRAVGLLWLSPDCTHFSRAKGSKPRSKKTRALAWLAVKWARDVRPRVIVLENVEEFATWGPLDSDGMPDKRRAGLTFRVWLGKLRALGYAVEWRSLVAADYGAPTTRRRLFLVARCDGGGIAWPEPTHGRGRSLAWRAAHEVIDWTLPCPSIFARRKPLAEATLRRIAEGLRRYVIDAPQPFIVPLTHHGRDRGHSLADPVPTITAAHRGELALVAPFIAKHFGGPNGNSNAGLDARSPLGTITGQDHHALATAFLAKFYGTSTGATLSLPLPTVTGGGQHLAAVRAYLVKYYGADGSPRSQQSLFEPLHTITSKARFGLVTVHGEPYEIVDIGMRMLAPRELFNAQGFPASYVIEHDAEGRTFSKTAQIERVGNSVCPPVARAIVEANFGVRAEVAA